MKTYEFYEKADETIVRECEAFLEQNTGKEGVGHLDKDAEDLRKKLMQSLQESDTEFDAAVKGMDEANYIDDGMMKERKMLQGRDTQFVLYLDKKAHDILDRLVKFYLDSQKMK